MSQLKKIFQNITTKNLWASNLKPMIEQHLSIFGFNDTSKVEYFVADNVRTTQTQSGVLQGLWIE